MSDSKAIETPLDRLHVIERIRVVREMIEIRCGEITGANAFVHRESFRDIDITLEQLQNELRSSPAAHAERPDPPLLKTVLSLDGQTLLARFYDYPTYEQWLRAALSERAPETPNGTDVSLYHTDKNGTMTLIKKLR